MTHDYEEGCGCSHCKEVLARAPSRLRARRRHGHSSSYIEASYVYAPYVPLQTTQTIFSPDELKPSTRAARYAKTLAAKSSSFIIKAD